jgi:EmrB/QacA subfamily drug resistance transporter
VERGAAAEGAEREGLEFSTARGRWVIAATVLGSGVAMIDATVVGIALKTIGTDFRVSLGPLQWVVTGYTLTLAAFLLIGGSLGDRFGRRRIFMIGTAWFAVASVLCGFAPNVEVLIVMRVLQGVGGALLTPGSLAILESSFVAADRARAIGAWSGLGGVAAAAGPVLGGYLVSAASWRFIFFINVPVAITVLVVSARHVPESRDTSSTGRIDIPGAALAVLALGGVNYLLVEGSSSGWTSPGVLAAAGLAFVSMVAFVSVERLVRSPMLPISIFGNRQFRSTNLVTFAVYAALGGALFLLPIELQVVSRYSPLASGSALIPVTAIMLALSARSGRLATRIGPRLQMSVGPLVVAGGLALLVRATSGSNYFEYVLPAVVVFGSGLAIGDSHERGAPTERGHRVCGQQRRRPDREPRRGGGTALVGRHGREHLSAPAPAGERLQDRGAHRRRLLRRGWCARGVRDTQPGGSTVGRPGHAGPRWCRRADERRGAAFLRPRCPAAQLRTTRRPPARGYCWTSITGFPSGSVIAARVGVPGRSKGSATTVPPISATLASVSLRSRTCT